VGRPKIAPQIQNGRRPPSEKTIDCYISATDPLISTQFCTLMHIGPPKPVKKIKFLKIQYGGRPPFWKTLNAISLQPFDWFWWNLAWRCILGLPMWRATKNIKKKSKMENGGHLENRKIVISPKPFSQFLIKFCMMIHISPPELNRCLKNQTFKNPRWRTAAILKNFKCDIWATVWPIFVKFGMVMHIKAPNLTVYQKN